MYLVECFNRLHGFCNDIKQTIETAMSTVSDHVSGQNIATFVVYFVILNPKYLNIIIWTVLLEFCT